MTWERVYTIWHYHDGPRSGVADFQDSPHFFVCVFDEAQDDWSDLFQLSAIDPSLMPLIEERREIFLRWKRALLEKKTPIDTHPALPGERARYDEISKTIDPMSANPKNPRMARASFRKINVDGLGTEVEWQLVRGEVNTATG
jgi:hypothetical protein